ncbi:dihydrolipoyl dehydrogenase [Denitromonas ohlonensis]|uniref:Dihydrolipoyl dehydrogenase n=2 Tax=Denitromonas TaxID=139331 RepID=A0A558E4F6_9RHOO|nr:dihydrolipoyl dehydrogenase [Denitromonas ohlonensis]TVO65812.1 dihydrolipoyl dehydrogenase [Denitromonas ohlonensis]TVO79405.1 dihydrolipoyl dehydrogenase [Denitromonas ohlonensis]TVT50016.1 MAG: dihydrolipoyl dehydrogenase [Denitromonas halophila]TVT68287.1 MAG: dihydrolipoyl dehydrogenase [Denitromonas halophila]
MSKKQFDVLVIGGGPGGYVAAIRAAQLGFSAACAESNPYADPKGEPRLGGTCLNVGCIPSKALLHTSHMFEEASHDFADQGIKVGTPSIDVPTMVARKAKIVDQLTGGIKGLFKKNKVTMLPGHGSFVGQTADGWDIKVGDEVIGAKQVIIATGSTARHLPGIPVDNTLICDNIGALDLDAVPKRLGLIGSGVIGLEMGSVWRRLGAEVTILEAMDSFLGAADQDVAKEAQKVFAKQGLAVKLGVKVGKVTPAKNKKSVTVEFEDKDGAQKAVFDKLIVSVGRVPNTDGLNAEAVGLKLTDRGMVDVNDHCQTNLPGVWAVGDVVRGPMLAHKAMEEAVMVCELMAGQAGHCDFNTIPWVIYTSPEIAWVGKTEQQLKADGVAYRAGKIPFMANGRALGMGAPTGFVKMLACAETDRILGVHIIGANASELISEAVVAMEFHGAAEDLARICHAHPTMSEAVHEAALAVDKRPLHF